MLFVSHTLFCTQHLTQFELGCSLPCHRFIVSCGESEKHLLSDNVIVWGGCWRLETEPHNFSFFTLSYYLWFWRLFIVRLTCRIIATRSSYYCHLSTIQLWSILIGLLYVVQSFKYWMLHRSPQYTYIGTIQIKNSYLTEGLSQDHEPHE